MSSKNHVLQIAIPGERKNGRVVGRVYTGIAKGKVYPYRSAKRGGASLMALTPRRVVGRTGEVID